MQELKARAAMLVRVDGKDRYVRERQLLKAESPIEIKDASTTKDFKQRQELQHKLGIAVVLIINIFSMA